MLTIDEVLPRWRNQELTAPKAISAAAALSNPKMPVLRQGKTTDRRPLDTARSSARRKQNDSSVPDWLRVGPTAWMINRAGRLGPGVISTSPVSQPFKSPHASSNAGPVSACIAPWCVNNGAYTQRTNISSRPGHNRIRCQQYPNRSVNLHRLDVRRLFLPAPAPLP